MRIVDLLLCLLTGLLTATADEYIFTNQTSITTGQDQGLGVIDPRFKVVASMEGRSLPMISLLMSTVELLASLAPESFTQPMSAASWISSRYQEVKLSFVPMKMGGVTDRRFIIWGFSLVAAYMMNVNRCQEGTFTLKWDDMEVGTLVIGRFQPEPCSGVSIHDSSPAASNGTACSPTAEIDGAENDRRLQVLITLNEPVLGVYDVFRLSIAILVDAAEKGPLERLFFYQSTPNIPNIELRVSVPIFPPWNPPIFQYQWLIKAIASVPPFMIREGRFREAVIAVNLDGIRVANAVLRAKISSGNGLPLLNPNVTVS